MALIGVIAVLGVALASSAQAAPPNDAHDRGSIVATLQDAHDRGSIVATLQDAHDRGGQLLQRPSVLQDANDRGVPSRPTEVAGPAGFDWGDAAIGAISGMGLAIFLAGVLLLTLGPRTRTRAAVR